MVTVVKARADSLLGKLARAAAPGQPWLRVTVSPWLARLLVAAGARRTADSMTVNFIADRATPAAPRWESAGVLAVDAATTGSLVLEPPIRRTGDFHSEGASLVAAIITSRAYTRGLLHALARVRVPTSHFVNAVVHDLDFDLELVSFHDSVIVFTHDLDRVRGLAPSLDRMLFPNLDLIRRLVRELDRIGFRSRDRLLGGAHANASDFSGARAAAREFDHAIARAVAHARALTRVLDEAAVDASGMDLSDLQVPYLDLLVGVIWTQETIWPVEITAEIRARSHEIRPGVYQVVGGNEREDAGLVHT
ncbi:hypothetical protein ABZU32_20605 [Sphaerisporangium sp. NPDC005288]|uniref:hypothetical protein n=1 Tax=Sphaerisporangium sp. NPDC005288 TaxID=3155114 RepID=UPI0033AADBF9